MKSIGRVSRGGGGRGRPTRRGQADARVRSGGRAPECSRRTVLPRGGAETRLRSRERFRQERRFRTRVRAPACCEQASARSEGSSEASRLYVFVVFPAGRNGKHPGDQGPKGNCVETAFAEGRRSVPGTARGIDGPCSPTGVNGRDDRRERTQKLTLLLSAAKLQGRCRTDPANPRAACQNAELSASSQALHYFSGRARLASISAFVAPVLSRSAP